MQNALLQFQQTIQQQQQLQHLVALQQLQRQQQQHKQQQAKQQQQAPQQQIKPPQIGIDFSKVAPDVLEGFVNVCPTCGIHSFFSPISLELHKNICAKVLQHEWISYSKVSFCTYVKIINRIKISMLTTTRLVLPTEEKKEADIRTSPTVQKSLSGKE